VFFGYKILTSIPGIYPPGYEQRRAERLKERYGFDVPPPVSASP